MARAMVPSQHEVAEKLCNVLGIDANMVYRVVLDVRADGLVWAYVQMLVSDKILEFDWESLADTEVTIADKVDKCH